MSRNASYYEILNSSQNASYEELKENYKKLILQCHPDKLQNQQNQRKQNPPQDNQHQLQHQHHQLATQRNCDILASDNNDDNDDDDGEDLALGKNEYSNENERNFILINEAWNILKDPSKRKLYDAELLVSKFQSHSNIFAHITLADMEVCFEENEEEEEGKGKVEAAAAPHSHAIYYSYNCRCGGQYIVDDSAQSEFFKKIIIDAPDTTRTSTSTSTSGSGESNNTSSASLSCHNNVGNNDNIVDNKDNGPQSGDATTKPLNDVQEEILVECSECSLVIVLQPQQTTK